MDGGMDTSKFDDKMAQLRQEEVDKSKAGRPKGPETAQFRIQVKAAHLVGIKNWFKRQYGYEQPDEFWERAANGVYENAGAYKIEVTPQDTQTEVNELKGQTKALLEDNEKLTIEVGRLHGKIQQVARMTTDERLLAAIRQIDQLKAHIKKLEETG